MPAFSMPVLSTAEHIRYGLAIYLSLLATNALSILLAGPAVISFPAVPGLSKSRTTKRFHSSDQQVPNFWMKGQSNKDATFRDFAVEALNQRRKQLFGRAATPAAVRGPDHAIDRLSHSVSVSIGNTQIGRDLAWAAGNLLPIPKRQRWGAALRLSNHAGEEQDPYEDFRRR